MYKVGLKTGPDTGHKAAQHPAHSLVLVNVVFGLLVQKPTHSQIATNRAMHRPMILIVYRMLARFTLPPFCCEDEGGSPHFRVERGEPSLVVVVGERYSALP